MYNIGDKVVYPVHGAGIIEGVEEKEFLGEKQKYYVLKLPLDNMKVTVPMANMKNLGIRDIISSDEVTLVLSILSSEESAMDDSWNKRYRDNVDRIKTGNIFEIAEVLKNLVLKDREKSLSTGEKKILTDAKKIIISELMLVLDLSKEEVEAKLDKSLD